MMRNIRQYEVPLHKYMAMMDLQVTKTRHHLYLEEHESVGSLL